MLIDSIIKQYEFETKLISIGNVQMGISVLEYFKNLAESLQIIGYDYHRFIIYLDEIIKSKKEIKFKNNENNILKREKNKENI